MSGVAIAQYILANNAALIAVVPAARIKAGVLPLNTPLPAISVTLISGQQYNTLAQNQASYMVRHRVQVSVLAKTYESVKQIQRLVRMALPQTRDTINGYGTDEIYSPDWLEYYTVVRGFQCDAIYPDTEGPDLFDHTSLIHQGSIDYRITFRR